MCACLFAGLRLSVRSLVYNYDTVWVNSACIVDAGTKLRDSH